MGKLLLYKYVSFETTVTFLRHLMFRPRCETNQGLGRLVMSGPVDNDVIPRRGPLYHVVQ